MSSAYGAGRCHRKSRSRGRRLWFEHKRDADAGTFKAIEESAFERALIGLRRELAADLVARADQQMTLRYPLASWPSDFAAESKR